jgi:predicted RNase H-like HicB family nuclease
MRYLIIIEQAEHNLSAYAPDLPGCIATGATREDVIASTREAIELHLQGLSEDGEPIPVSNSEPAFVEVTLSPTVA